MSFNRPTLSELIERGRADVEARLPGADSRLRHSLLDIVMRGHGGVAAGLYGYLDYISRQVLPDTADGEHLARWASIWGINRKSAIGASGSVTFTGTSGVTIPAGTELTRIDGTEYKTSAAGTLASGTADIAVEAIDGGPSTNMAAAGELTLTSPIAGIQSVALVDDDGLTSGAEEEDDAALLARLLQRIQLPPDGGSVSDYERWALAFDEVTRVWVYPAWMGLGSVGIAFVMDGRDDILPLEDDVEALGEHLEPLRPVTANVVVFAPTAQPVDIMIRLVPDTSEVRLAVEAELADMFARDTAPGGTIYLSRIGEAISLAAGENNHQLLLPSQDIEAPQGFMPFLGEVSYA
ncbi:baseplate J/gp47 family protein [Sphingorhabdus sp. 109]|uniref:baseplate J/gp47 family protein n=1 Tax=Sphingorhabdus sp. 109 TaxID=2653173 RepID=UPI0012EF3257|nr:baseplate J/gp47 family protein [Sphingorhabdus sp. 109]VWX62612.1 Baseplate J protein [Sphingorhabdus sp. 109]